MSKANKHAGMSFDQHVQTAVQMAIRGNIKAEVEEAAMILAQETKKALSSMKMRLDALEAALIKKAVTSDGELKEALWNVQETLFGLTQIDTAAELGNGVRLRVKEEEIGKETDAAPATESYVVLGQNDLPENIQQALIGAKAGEVRTLEMEGKAAKEGEANPKYKITLAVDRVYKAPEAAKETPNASQG